MPRSTVRRPEGQLGRAYGAEDRRGGPLQGGGTRRRTFYAHHLAAISNAVVMADASTVTQFTNELAFKLSIGLPF